jgi:hypothetical protein
MNILFLYPHPAEDRLEWYRSAALALRDRFGHKVVFVYVGDKRHFSDSLPTEHFDSWVGTSRQDIEAARLIELERSFPASNLWRCMVSQRTLCDYSYLGGSFAWYQYPLSDIEFYLKAVVMFYANLVRKYEIEIAMAHAPDEIHSHALYELARSLPFVAINQYYDEYWNQGYRYVIDEVSFSSSVLRRRYRENLERYHERIFPIEREIEQDLLRCQTEDPRKIYTAAKWSTSVSGGIRTAAKAFFDDRRRFRWMKPTIMESYYKHHAPKKFKALIKRLSNLAVRRLFLQLDHALPDCPYVFFAPHYQPEATTLASSPVWSDMLAVIRILSVSLPAGFKLVVKDHPAIGGLRSPAFYRSILELPNAVLLSERFPTEPLIVNSAMVCTLSGTVGLQALMHGRQLLLFGHVYYDCIDGILRPPPDLNDLPMLMKDVLVNGKRPGPGQSRAALMSFMEAYRFVMTKNEKMEASSSPQARGDGLAELIHHWATVDLVGHSYKTSN